MCSSDLTCRRSGQRLIDLGRAISHRLPLTGGLTDASFRDRIPAGQGDDSAIDIRLYGSTHEQYDDIAQQLHRAHLDAHKPMSWSSMAVLVRSGVRSIPGLRRALQSAGIPVEVAGDEIPLRDDPAVGPLLLALRMVVAPSTCDPDDTRQLLTGPLGGATMEDLRFFGRQLRAAERIKRGPSGVIASSDELIHGVVGDPGLADEFDGPGARRAQQLGELILLARAVMDGGGTAHEVLWSLWEQKPQRDGGSPSWAHELEDAVFRGGARGRRADRDLDAIVALFTLAARETERGSSRGVAAFLDQLWKQEFPADTLADRGISGEAVRVMTAHRAKGLEWDFVVLADVQEDLWPDLRRRGGLLNADLLTRDGIALPAPTHTMLAEERRLFYVGVTRAKRSLLVTAIDGDDEAGRRSRFVDEVLEHLDLPAEEALVRHGMQDRDLGSSMVDLVADLRRALLDPDTVEADREVAAQVLARLSQIRSPHGPVARGAHPDSWWGLSDATGADIPVYAPDEEIRLSGSQLETLQSCPLRWFLSKSVRAEGRRKDQLATGAVIHAVAAEASRTGAAVTEADLVEQVEAAWARIGFETQWQAEAELGKAREALAAFTRWHNEAMTKQPRLLIEERFSRTVDIGGRKVSLSGSIDRLEILTVGNEDGKTTTMRVFDLKSGRTTGRTEKGVKTDLQLGLYQWAVASSVLGADGLDGLDEVASFKVDEGSVTLGEAALVFLGKRLSGGRPTVWTQDGLQIDDVASVESWVDETVEDLVEVVAQSRFFARPTEKTCRYCEFTQACPGQPSGGQVVR